ncbi:MAG: hypothetical protein HC850_08575, partial [Rhodomicrobium sp.]|nr:hypothetical protein [Rhodomicrobium sp.]
MLLFVVAAALGALLGAINSLRGASDGDRAAASWATPTPPQGDAATNFYTALIATGHFGEAEPTDVSSPGGEASPPTIAMTALVDGAIIVGALGEDGRTSSFRIGDVMPGGWRLTKASLDAITLERDGEILHVQVYP